jgi:hypothetical protein
MAYAAWNQCRPLARLRQPETATRLMAFAMNHWTAQFGPLAPEDMRYVRNVRRLARAQLGAVAEAALWEQGLQLPLGQAMALAEGPPA